jgi:hypothetical protein
MLINQLSALLAIINLSTKVTVPSMHSTDVQTDPYLFKCSLQNHVGGFDCFGCGSHATPTKLGILGVNVYWAPQTVLYVHRIRRKIVDQHWVLLLSKNNF